MSNSAMRINRIISIVTLLMAIISVKAQLKFPGAQPGYWTPNPNSFVDVQTPTAASLGKYGDVGVSYFTGNPNITIPLYEMNVRGVKMPISLDYDATGVMPNSLPSWAGQNWTLNIGGVITRTVKGRRDEWKNPKHIEASFSHKPVNYFECHDKLIEYMDEGGNYSKLKKDVAYCGYDYAPDEYTFHFMGKSGKFFLDQDGNWRVQSNDNLEVIYDYNDPSNLIGSLFEKYPYSAAIDQEQSKTIAGFVIRDDEGNVYTFGYDKNAIDYTTNFWHMSANEDNETWHASSWYLTKVADRFGNILYKLHYQRGAYIIQVFNAYYNDYVNEKATGMLGASFSYSTSNQFFPYTISISSPVYLQKIEAMDGIRVIISSENVGSTLATENLYHSLYSEGVQELYRKLVSMVDAWGISQNGALVGGFYYLQNNKDSLADFRYPSSDDYDVLSRARIRKLKYLDIQWARDKAQNYKAYRFCMSQTSNRRLRLDSLMVQNDAVHYSITTGINGIYRFKYNQFEKLPEDYLTSCVDHWGYYNGNAYKQADWSYANNMESFRNPDFNYTPIGILDEIVYPTGGVTDFEYESNTYSKKLSNDRQSISNADGVGGGLRIKSIKSYDSEKKKNLLSQKDYSYNIPGTDKSSGELFASPLYYWKDWSLKCEQKNASYHMTTFHTSSIVPLANSTGVSLGYSYVTETVRDIANPGKFHEQHVYHYSNLSDPSVRDQRFTLTFGYVNQFTPFDEWSELGFKKGVLLNVKSYDGNGKKVKSVGYKYRKDNYLKDYVYTSNLVYECYGNSAQYSHYLGGVYKLYYPKYDVVEEQDTMFCSNGAKMVTTHTYDKSDVKFNSWKPYKHQVGLRIVNSEALNRGVFSETNTYSFGNFNASSGNDSILYKGDFYVKPYKTIYTRNGQLVSEETTTYSANKVNGKSHLLPKLVTRKNSNNVVDTLYCYYSYTNTGMPAIYKEKGKPETFLRWAWNDSFLMMVGNAYIPISITDKQFIDQEACSSYINSFLKGYLGHVTGYVWNPLFGPTAIILSNGNVNSFKYDRFGRLTSVYDYNNVLLKEYEYNYRK